MSLGGYQWVAVFRDGTVLHQYPSDGEEQSIDKVQSHLAALRKAQPVSEADGPDPIDCVVDLHPLDGAPHPFTRIEIRPGERLIKEWVRTVDVFATPEGDRHVQRPAIDCLGIRPMGRSRKAVFTYLLPEPDGSMSIKITTSQNP